MDCVENDRRHYRLVFAISGRLFEYQFNARRNRKISSEDLRPAADVLIRDADTRGDRHLHQRHPTVRARRHTDVHHVQTRPPVPRRQKADHNEARILQAALPILFQVTAPSYHNDGRGLSLFSAPDRTIADAEIPVHNPRDAQHTPSPYHI